MAATGVPLFPANLSPVFRSDAASSSIGKSKPKQISFSNSSRRFAVSTEQPPTTATTDTKTTSRFSGSGRLEKREEAEAAAAAATRFEDPAVERGSLKDYFERSKELVSQSGGGPPRWFTPLECGPPLTNSPLLLFLPGLSFKPIFLYSFQWLFCLLLSFRTMDIIGRLLLLLFFWLKTFSWKL